MRKLPDSQQPCYSTDRNHFQLNSRIKETNVLSKFHENWAKNVTSSVFKCFHFIHIKKNAPPTGGHVFSPISTIFKLVRDIKKTAPPTGGHVFQRIGTTFELIQDIIKTNILTNFELGRDFIGTKLLTKFNEDGTRNQMLTDGRAVIRRTKTGHKSSPEQNELSWFFIFTSSWVVNMESVSEKPTALTEIRFLDFWIGGQAVFWTDGQTDIQAHIPTY
ncbi:hypothetical protein DPMN_051580 [Dreissena polymorpha]|uniref:Uncharacterized protein n=1 Tax=Dreissena polymorpha TaxID=45954 RepID=A0A9D4CJ90_DREPO|nr:hypothetical protein DPMN_051580 [Dreissena polymorpha]